MAVGSPFQSTKMDDIDIWRAAQQMRKQFGIDAAIQAALRADKLLDQGDTDGHGVWNRVVAAINELDRSTPRVGEAQH